MLSITAFTFQTSFAREAEIYVQNWLSICLPALAVILHSATKSQLCAEKNQTIEPQTFSNDDCHMNILTERSENEREDLFKPSVITEMLMTVDGPVLAGAYCSAEIFSL